MLEKSSMHTRDQVIGRNLIRAAESVYMLDNKLI